MIIVFHSLIFVIKYGINIFKNLFTLQIMRDRVNLETNRVADTEENLSFDPPVYKQRYGEIQNILLDNPWKTDIKKIVDFGCAEFKLFMFLKQLCRIEHVLQVDIDEELLKQNLFRIRPLIADYLRKRTDPLLVEVLCGSISDPDRRLLGVDAVIGIEIIEHLYPDTLEALPYNVFGFIKPKIAMFTTPNSDFNVIFPGFKGFRHDDHKFEWSREQFESWAINITNRFREYNVSFQGIGEGPKGTEHLGCCSQMAVFIKIDDSNAINTNPFTKEMLHMKSCECVCRNCIPNSSYGVCKYFSYTQKMYSSLDPLIMSLNEKDHGDCTKNDDEYYKSIEIINYPYDIDERSPEQKILDHLQYKMRIMGSINGRFYNEVEGRVEIPLIDLVFNHYDQVTTVTEAREILHKAGFKLEECTVCEKLETCIIYESDMESRSSTPVSRSQDDSSADKDYYSEWTVGTTEAEASDWEVDSDIQKGIWVVDDESQQAEEALRSVNAIIGNLVNDVELLVAAQESSTVEASQNHMKKEEEEKIIDNLENNPDPTNLMFDSGYYKSNTNLTNSPQSYSEALDDPFNNANSEINKLGKKPIVPVNVTLCSNENNFFSKKGEKLSSDTNMSDQKYEVDVLHLKDDKLSLDSVATNNIENGKTFINGKSIIKELLVVKSKVPIGDLKMTLASKTNDSNMCANKANNLKDNIRESTPGTSDIKKKRKFKRFDNDDDDNPANVLKREGIEMQMGINEREERQDEEVVPELIEIAQVPELIVENGDLANNNRDLEGNNYPNAEQQNAENDNEHVVLQNNDIDAAEPINEDIENRNAVEEDEVNNEGEDAIALDAEPFPNWLLHLLGAEYMEDDEHHDEPHFYCQGDGIGVHPSFIEGDFEDEHSSSESDSSSTGSSSSESTTDSNTDEAEATPSISLSDADVGSLPEDMIDAIIEQNVIPLEQSPNIESQTTAIINNAGSSSGTESTDEFFDTFDEALSLGSSTRSEKYPSTNETKNKN